MYSLEKYSHRFEQFRLGLLPDGAQAITWTNDLSRWYTMAFTEGGFT